MNRLSPKKVNVYFLLVLAAASILGIIAALTEIIPLVGVSFVLIFGDFIFRLLFFRCPHCGRYLDRSTGDFCPFCGKKIDE